MMIPIHRIDDGKLMKDDGHLLQSLDFFKLESQAPGVPLRHRRASQASRFIKKLGHSPFKGMILEEADKGIGVFFTTLECVSFHQ